MHNELPYKPCPAKEILKVSDDRAANIAAANSRVDLFKTDAQKMKELANGMRLVLNTQCDSYKNHVIETFLDCDYKKVKISKRIAKGRKSEKPARWNVCK